MYSAARPQTSWTVSSVITGASTGSVRIAVISNPQAQDGQLGRRRAVPVTIDNNPVAEQVQLPDNASLIPELCARVGVIVDPVRSVAILAENVSDLQFFAHLFTLFLGLRLRFVGGRPGATRS